MAVQHATQEVLPYATGVTYLTFMSTMPPETVLGAFAGSIVFLLGVSNQPKWKWMLFFMVAFMAGLLGASGVAGIISGTFGLVGIKINAPLGMGSMVAAATTVNMISWLRDNAARIAAKRLGVEPKKGEDA
jgi:hypothetical protein